jgi:two-component system chemotaxis sensor kinase CheA
MSDSFDKSAFIDGFLAECEDHMRNARAALSALETSLSEAKENPRAVRELYRTLHTVKGVSAMVEIEPLVQIAHAMEELLRHLDAGSREVDAHILESLGQGLRAVEARLDRVARKEEVPKAPAPLLERLTATPQSARVAPIEEQAVLGLDPIVLGKMSDSERSEVIAGLRAGRRVLRVDYVPSPDRARAGISITTVRERLGQSSQIIKVVPLSGGPSSPGLVFALVLVTDLSDRELAEAAHAAPESVVQLSLAASRPAPVVQLEVIEEMHAPAAASGMVRVPVERLDDALERISDLVITRFRLVKAVRDLAASGVMVRELEAILSDEGRQLRDLRGAIMSARLVSVAELFERIPLLVRGLSATSKKKIKLEIESGRAEVDKAVGDRLFPAMVHLLRNAVDHAIELPEERERAGKNPEATLRVRCLERADSRLEIQISDDGRGIDVEALAKAANRPPPNNEVELMALLTAPGVSTAPALTTTSGRGMGMEIVRRVIVDELTGELTVSSEPKGGTTFTLIVPLSVAILEAFTLALGKSRFVVPVAMVEAIVEVEPARVFSAPGEVDSSRVRMFERRGEVVPLLALESLLDMPPSRAGSRKAIIVRRRDEPVAFEVDLMLGRQEVVVRPIEDPLVRVPGITGSTDLGDGKLTLVLDLMALSRREMRA